MKTIEKEVKGKKREGKGREGEKNGWLSKLHLRVELSKSDKKRPLGRPGPSALDPIGLTAAQSTGLVSTKNGAYACA